MKMEVARQVAYVKELLQQLAICIALQLALHFAQHFALCARNDSKISRSIHIPVIPQIQ